MKNISNSQIFRGVQRNSAAFHGSGTRGVAVTYLEIIYNANVRRLPTISLGPIYFREAEEQQFFCFKCIVIRTSTGEIVLRPCHIKLETEIFLVVFDGVGHDSPVSYGSGTDIMHNQVGFPTIFLRAVRLREAGEDTSTGKVTLRRRRILREAIYYFLICQRR